MPERGTVLAFDFGLKRIGVAVGEPELGTAHPLPAVSDFFQIQKLVEEWKPASLVVGLPTSANGEPHKMTRQAQDFARRLEERFTSVEAEHRLRGLKKKAVDSVAAQLILEQYFDDAA